MKPGISLLVMVKDEAKNLLRSLEKTRGVVDEIVVCDTGSTDNTIEVAQSFGARIVEHPWNEDMAEVRNFLMTKAEYSHALVLDADEAFSFQDHASFREEAASCMAVEGASICFPERNYTKRGCSIGFTINRKEYPDDEFLTGWFVTPSVRLMPTSTRYAGQVHENPLVDLALVRLSKLPLHHWAQVDPERQGKKGWYYQGGLRKLKEFGDNFLIRRELGAQAMRDGDYADAVEHWMHAVAFEPKDCIARTNLVSALVHVGKFKAAKHQAYQAQNLGKHVPEAAYNCAWCELLTGDAGRAAQICRGILSVAPEYVPAVVLGVVACACQTGHPALFDTMRQKFNHVDEALSNIITKLRWAGQPEYAAKLSSAAGVDIP